MSELLGAMVQSTLSAEEFEASWERVFAWWPTRIGYNVKTKKTVWRWFVSYERTALVAADWAHRPVKHIVDVEPILIDILC